MEYTLADFLRADILRSYTVLTTWQDFEHIFIKSISVQELPVDDFIRPGELVLSTALGCQENEKAFCALIESIGASQAAAVLLAFKDDAYKVPASVVEYACRIQLPLIVIPWDIRFSDVQIAVIHNIQDRKLAVYKDLQDSLFNAFFDSKPLSAAAELIFESLRTPVTVADENGVVLAVSSGFDAQEKEPFCAAEISLNDMAVGQLRLYLPDSDDNKSHAMSFDAELAEKYICFPLALWFNRKSIEDIMALRLKDDFVWNLATQHYESMAEIIRQGARFHFDLTRPYVCLVFKAVPKADGSAVEAQAKEVARTISEIEKLLIRAGKESRRSAMVASRSLEFILYLEISAQTTTESIDAFLDELEPQLEQAFPAYEYYCGISEISFKTLNFHPLYKNASLALQYCMNSSQRRYRFTYRDTREAQVVSVLADSQLIQTLAHEVLDPLREYDTGSDIDLMGTLTAYIRCNYNVSQTARDLHIHRQSLLYRLEKIEDLTEMSLSNHRDLFLLEICSRIFSAY